jgi:hypothetical protein
VSTFVVWDRCRTAKHTRLIPADRIVEIGRKNDRFKKIEEQLKMSYLAPDSEWFLTTLVETANS